MKENTGEYVRVVDVLTRAVSIGLLAFAAARKARRVSM
jgi:hypothetical protein